MQCNYNSFIQIINFHGLFRNALRCRKTGACRILVPLRYPLVSTTACVTVLRLIAAFTFYLKEINGTSPFLGNGIFTFLISGKATDLSL